MESQVFISNTSPVPKDMTRINGLAGNITVLRGWPPPSDDSVFLSLRLQFQKRKTTRPRKDKSFSVCFRKSKPNKIHVGGFWRVTHLSPRNGPVGLSSIPAWLGWGSYRMPPTYARISCLPWHSLPQQSSPTPSHICHLLWRKCFFLFVIPSFWNHVCS